MKELLANLLVVALLVSGCAMGSGEASKERSKSGSEQPSNVYVIFDPTIALEGQGDRSAMLGGVAERVRSSLRENARLTLFVVGTGVFRDPPVFNQKIQEQHGTAWERRLREEQDKILTSLVAAAEGAWSERQSLDSRIPTSCLLTALARVEEDLHSGVNGEGRSIVFLVTDLMEACGEWGRFVNLERGIGELDSFRETSPEMNLRGVEEVVVLHVGNSPFVTPTEVRELREAWREVFERSGVPRESLRIVSHLSY